MRLSRRLVILLGVSLVAVHAAGGEKPQNIILFIGDGMGMNHVQAASMYKAFNEKRSPVQTRLAFEEFPVTGYLTTHADGNPVTDSAAAGTALACGVKTRNGMIGKASDGRDVDSIASIARKGGRAVGIVTTVALDDATPSVFYAHAGSRKETEKILDQAFASTTFDVLMGGRILCKAYNGDTLAKKCESSGIFYLPASNLATFVPSAAAGRRVLGCLPATGQEEPKLPLITRRALDVLVDRAAGKGFFMVVEAGKIDGQSHGNSMTNMIEEVLGLHQAVTDTVEFLKEKGILQKTLLVVTADHETGGLVFGENALLKKIPKSAAQAADASGQAMPQAYKIGNVTASWTLGGHTCTWVPVFACGPEALRFSGRHDNTDVAGIIGELLK